VFKEVTNVGKAAKDWPVTSAKLQKDGGRVLERGTNLWAVKRKKAFLIIAPKIFLSVSNEGKDSYSLVNVTYNDIT
jgi:hypothetical protein